jgi:hypothetical protein
MYRGVFRAIFESPLHPAPIQAGLRRSVACVPLESDHAPVLAEAAYKHRSAQCRLLVPAFCHCVYLYMQVHDLCSTPLGVRVTILGVRCASQPALFSLLSIMSMSYLVA